MFFVVNNAEGPQAHHHNQAEGDAYVQAHAGALGLAAAGVHVVGAVHGVVAEDGDGWAWPVANVHDLPFPLNGLMLLTSPSTVPLVDRFR